MNELVWLERSEQRNRKAKLQPRWKGPYKIVMALGNNSYKLVDKNGEQLTAPVNARRLKKFRRYLSQGRENETANNLV